MKFWAGVFLLVLLVIQIVIKANQDVLSEMIWACYPATLMLAIGLIFDIALLSASGFLFQLCIGLPADLLYLFGKGHNNWVSFLIHFLAPVIGLWIWRKKTLPFTSILIAASLFIVFALIAYFFTAPELNINQVFKPWKPVAFLGLSASRILNAALLFLLLFIGRTGINRCLVKF